jgi:predicted transcriptional regulator
LDKTDKTRYETVYIRDEISRCEDVIELKRKIIPMIKTQHDQWTEKINDLIAESGFTKTRFAELLGVSRMAVNKWCNGAIPKNRETFLRIGMVAGYNREKMDQLLMRYGRYPALYAKSLEDCVCIYVLEKDNKDQAIQNYDLILNRIKENIIREESSETEDITTERFDEKLSVVRDEGELERFISDNSSVFAMAYHKFYAYVKMHIRANYEVFDGNVYALAQGQEWSSSLRQCVSAIRQNKWYPTRNKIISLGLHLSMDHEQIDEMLKLAHMEPLCAKNIFESIIMFILDDADLNNILDDESDEYDPDALCNYAREVMEKLDFPEVDSFITELPEKYDE